MTVAKTAVSPEKLTIAIVHFNTPAVTIACVASLLTILDRSPVRGGYRIVIVDNRSEPDALDALQSGLAGLACDRVILVRNCFNAGFGLGCMLALNYSAAPYIAFINSDTTFDEDCFTPLIDHLEATPAAGVIGPQHRSIDGVPTRSYGYNETILGRLLGRAGHAAARAPQGPVEVDYVFGSFMLFRREALAASGGFDPAIFLFYEEMDICQRLRRHGYSCVFYPGAGFRHIGQASLGEVDDTKPESDVSLLYVTHKNNGVWAYRTLWVAKLVSYAVRAPFRPRYRGLLRRLLAMGAPQALSARTGQTCNFDYLNRSD